MLKQEQRRPLFSEVLMTNYASIDQLPAKYREQAAAQMRGPGKTAVPVVQNGQQVERVKRKLGNFPIYNKIVLMGERPESYNVVIRMHWRQYAKEVKRVKSLILAAIGPCDPIGQPVNLTFTPFYEKRPLDTSNLPEKLYEDGLVAAGLLVDDNREYVYDIIKRRPRVDKERPRLEIEIISI